jgi:hypothetical protein
MPSQTRDRPVPPPVLGELSPVESQASVWPQKRAGDKLFRLEGLYSYGHPLPNICNLLCHSRLPSIQRTDPGEY